MQETVGRANLPEPVGAALGAFTEEMKSAAGANLSGLVLYGGVARGRYRPGQSDVNVLVLLGRAGVQELEAVAPVAARARRRDGIEVIVLAASELKAAASEFPVKFLDIARAHIVLHGDDPLAGLEVDEKLVRHRLSQELRNLSLRLRRRYLLDHDDPPALRRALARTVTPLCVQLGILLEVDGKRPPGEDCAGVFDAACAEYGIDRPALAALEALRSGENAGDPKAAFAAALQAIDRLLERAEAEEVGL
jgi:predicted nucleotidyltransferase